VVSAIRGRVMLWQSDETMLCGRSRDYFLA
jgi:hypothetical protein